MQGGGSWWGRGKYFVKDLGTQGFRDGRQGTVCSEISCLPATRTVAYQSAAKGYDAICTLAFCLFDGQGKLYYRGRLDASRPRSGGSFTGEDFRSAIKAMLKGGQSGDAVS